MSVGELVQTAELLKGIVKILQFAKLDGSCFPLVKGVGFSLS